MVIRTYEQADQNALLEIWLNASRAGHPFFAEEELMRQYEIVREHYLPVAEIWMAEDESGPAGFIAMLGSMVGALFVDPKRHGQGIGTQLIRAMQDRHGTLEVGVLQPNAAARRFYSKLGFVEYGQEENTDVIPQQTVILMRLGGLQTA